jgi:DNA mismatch repair protein MutS
VIKGFIKSMRPAKLTPMMKQYLAIKEEYPDAILFYRMGDFYEMFFEDAELASRLLEIALTSRNKNDDTPVPMCGVPYRAAQAYISRLIEKGLKVAICDQTEDPAVAKGLVKREVVRIITPGMVVDDAFLNEKENNYILSFFRNERTIGISYLDISTGTFRLTESNDPAAILDESQRIAPREVLLPLAAKKDPAYTDAMQSFAAGAISYLDDHSFDYKISYERLTDQFQTITLEGFGCEALISGVSAAGALILYVQETQKQKVEHITGLETYTLSNYLVIDDISCRNLELEKNIRNGSQQGTLLSIIDKTQTAMGARMLKTWLRYPLTDIQIIEQRLSAVEEGKHFVQLRRSLRENLKSVFDMERLGNKITMGHANARDLLALKRSLQITPSILEQLSAFNAEYFCYNKPTDFMTDLSDLLERSVREDAPPTIQEGGMIKSGYHRELDELLEMSRDAKGWLAQLEVTERNATGINALKVRYNKVFGYYIEVPKSRSKEVPAEYVRKQTLVNAERYITDELKAFESKVLGAEDRRAMLEYEIFDELRQAVAQQNSEIQSLAHFLAQTDILLTLAEVADQNDYHRPRLTTDGCVHIEEGRHPVVEKMISGERFVPNSIRLDDDENQILIITGPNMAGKSTVLRQVALLVIMAQMGSFIPARKASISLIDRVFTRVGALDNLSQGQSTFMVEMQETANILNNASAQSLVIMDEIGRGTSTFDGMSIAWAVVEYLHDLHDTGVKTLFATHYHELTDLARTKDRVKNFNIAVKEWNDEIIFLRKLVEGGTNRSYGIQVARLAGIPPQVIQSAKKILYDIESGGHSVRALSTHSKKQSELQGPVQLNLFQKPDHRLLIELQKLDISKMTPLEALNFLSELQQKTQSESEEP